MGFKTVAQNGIVNAWSTLSMQQRLMAVGGTAALLIVFWFVVKLANQEAESLLFSGLDQSVAGDVASQLDGMDVPYTIKGSAIYVPDSQRDRLRLEMARQGIPSASSGGGYELLDNLNGFSTTSDMFDAAYWRAKEGELTRTILAMPGVKSARVHLGVTRQSAFRRASADKTASVTIEAPRGVNDDQARSIQFLTALAVADLKPDNVAVIDTVRGVIAGPGGRPGAGSSLQTEDRSRALEMSILSMLEAHVGIGNARVTVAMDVERESSAQTERLIDPDSRQIASRNVTEEQERLDGNSVGGAVTVASNLPDGDGEVVDEDDPRMVRTKRQEEVVYTGTQIERVTETAAGALRRLSIAVLINERTVADEEGNLLPDPRTEEELDTLEALVASAAGIDRQRGDALTLSILPFTQIIPPEIIEPSFVDSYIMPRAIEMGQLGFLGLLTLILGLFVVRPLLAPQSLPEGASATALPQDAAEMLTLLAEENPDDAAAILDAWFEEEKQPA